MTASSNAKPRSEDCTYIKRFAVSNEQAVYVGSFKRYHVHVGRSDLWLSGDLSIPLSTIRAKEIIKRGWLIKRFALRIVFESPVLGLDAVHLCDIDFLGFYHRKSLLDLSVAIDDAVRNTGLEETARSAELGRIPHRGGYFRSLAESFKGVFSSREALSRDFYRSVADGFRLEFDVGGESRRDLRSQLLAVAIRSNVDLNPEQLDRDRNSWVSTRRIWGIWTIVWGLAIPASIVGSWLAAGSFKSSTLEEIFFSVITALMAFVCLMGLSQIVGAILAKPFALMTNAMFGLDVKVRRGRRV